MERLLRRLAAGLALALLPASIASAADDPFLGHWRLDKTKSTIGHDPGVKTKQIVFSPAAGGGTITETLEMAAGNSEKKVSRLSYVYGKFMPQARPDLDAFEVTKSGHRMFWTARLKGKTIARLQVDLSPDGKEMTFRYLSAASDPTGAVTRDRYVYERE